MQQIQIQTTQSLLAELAGLGLAGIILYTGLILRRAVRPRPYDWPAWVYRARLEWRARRAERRQRRDEREAERSARPARPDRPKVGARQ